MVHQEAIWRKHVAHVLSVELAHDANAPAFASVAEEDHVKDEILSIASSRYSFSNADESRSRSNLTLVAQQCTPAPTQTKATEMKHKTLF